MKHTWNKLTAMTQDRPFRVTRVYMPEEDISIEGDFQLSPFGRLTAEEQMFAAAFIKSHGSIKQMESIFKISYPTVKNRLNAIASKLDIVDVKVEISSPAATVLERLERGEITAGQALEEIGS